MPETERSYTQNFFKLQYTIIQAMLSRKLMKKFAVTDEKIFRVYKAFDRRYEDFPLTAFGRRLSAWRGRLQK